MHNINSGVMVNMPDDPAQIVRFWHAVEMFSPQQLPRIAARNHVADFRPGDPMPWEPGGKLPQAKSGKIWRHVVFGGVYDLSKIRDVLVKKYGQDDSEAATRDQSALFACTVDADGYLVQESAVLSACAWAVGQKGHEQAKTETDGESRPRARLDQAPLTGSDLYRFTAELAGRLGVTNELHPQNIRVSSYVADDLALISAALGRGNAGSALSQYLATSPGTTRTDVQKEPLCVRAGCAPDRIPSGRWVTD